MDPAGSSESRPRDHRGAVVRGASTYARKKIGNACQVGYTVCRARRTKCDEERPCAFCRKTGATCVSSPSPGGHAWDPASLEILQRIEDLRDQLNSRLQETSQSIQSQIASLAVSSRRSEASPLTQPTYPGSSPVPSTSSTLHPERFEAILTWPVWAARGLAISQVRDGPCVGLSPEWVGKSNTPGADFEPSMAPMLLDRFLTHVHIKNPVLDEREIRSQMNALSLEGIGWNASSCLLLLVMANGAIEAPYLPSDDHHGLSDSDLQLSNSLFQAAQKRLGLLCNADHVTQAKCFFYSGVYLMAALRPFDAWRMFLQGLAACQMFVSQSTNTAEGSIYWSCWKSERELRTELSLPDFNPHGQDYPTMFPGLPEVCSDGSSGLTRAWCFYLAEISLWRLETESRTSIKECMNGTSDSSLDTLAAHVTMNLEPALESWRQSLPSVISFTSDTGNEEADMLRFVLRGRLTYNAELLTWPFLVAAIRGDYLSATAAAMAVKGTRVHYDRLVNNRPGFLHRHHGTWLMQRSSARSALVLIAAALAMPAETMPPGWVELVWATIAMLEFWKVENETAATLRDALGMVPL